MSLREVKFILENFDRVERVIRKVYAVKPRLIDMVLEGDLSERNFYKITSLLTPQSRSPLYEEYYVRKHGCIKVPVADGRGDFKTKDGEYVEYKVSAHNQDNALHIVQIRPHQKVSYIIQRVTARKVYTFFLTKQQMKAEINRIGTSAHGTKREVRYNKNKEHRITIQHDSEDWHRWVKNYSG